MTRGDGVTVIAPPPFCAGVCADVEFVREGPDGLGGPGCGFQASWTLG